MLAGWCDWGHCAVQTAAEEHSERNEHLALYLNTYFPLQKKLLAQFSRFFVYSVCFLGWQKEGTLFVLKHHVSSL